MSRATARKPVSSDLPPLLIDGHELRLEQLEPVARGEVTVTLSDRARAQLKDSRAVVEKILSREEAVYAINTGFGKFKDIKIRPSDSHKLQRNLILSHSAGVGPPFDRPVVRLILLLRANALAKGF